jgi:hypothetical protein
MPVASHKARPATWNGGLCVAAVLTICMALAACGQKATVPHGMGPLTPFLSHGSSGAWTGELKDQVYSLTDTNDQRAMRTITLARAEGSNFSAAVDISFGDQVKGFAGLVFAFARASPDKHLCFVALHPNGQIVLYSRSANTVTQIFTGTVKLRRGFNRLSFEGVGNEVTVKLNGKVVKADNGKQMRYVAKGLSEGSAGIAVGGIGSYKFTNFAATGYKLDTPPPAAQSPSNSVTKPSG